MDGRQGLAITVADPQENGVLGLGIGYHASHQPGIQERIPVGVGNSVDKLRVDRSVDRAVFGLKSCGICFDLDGRTDSSDRQRGIDAHGGGSLQDNVSLDVGLEACRRDRH